MFLHYLGAPEARVSEWLLIVVRIIASIYLQYLLYLIVKLNLLTIPTTFLTISSAQRLEKYDSLYVLLPLLFTYLYPYCENNPYPLRLRTTLFEKTLSTFRTRLHILKINPYPLLTRTLNPKIHAYTFRFPFRIISTGT